jgi:hypothetical protein
MVSCGKKNPQAFSETSQQLRIQRSGKRAGQFASGLLNVHEATT